MNNYNEQLQQQMTTMTMNNGNNVLQCVTIYTTKILLHSIVNNGYNNYNIVVYCYNIVTVMHFTVL